MFIIYVRETLALEEDYIALWKVLTGTAQPAINLFELVGATSGVLCATQVAFACSCVDWIFMASMAVDKGFI